MDRPTNSQGDTPTGDARLERIMIGVEAWLAQFARDAGCAEGEVTTRIEWGDPASALVAAQRGGDYDLVVVGSRGAGGVSRMLLGSVATAILRGASCPVLVVSGRRPAA